jgi:hypothetical protein
MGAPMKPRGCHLMLAVLLCLTAYAGRSGADTQLCRTKKGGLLVREGQCKA